MRRIRFDFGTLTLDAELLDTPTARAVAAALPISSSALTCTPGEVAYWPDGHAIALGFGRTPISRGDETRLASPCNIFAKAIGNVKALAQVKAGAKVNVTLID